MTRDLSRLLRPRHVAVMGSVWAENVIAQCARMGFQGDVWPVHPKRLEIGGTRAYSSLNALPEAPDATFIGVNRHATLEIVSELSAMGAGGAVCFASGWAESGDGSLQDDLVGAAGDMPILGPNCYGLINLLDGALLWPDQHGGKRVERGVAIISQSSNIAINLTMQTRGLPVAYVVCVGNAAQTGLADLGRALLVDDRVTGLGLYIEGFDNAPAFASMVAEARAVGKGVVALKAGKTAAGAAAAVSHTAALTGGGAASSAFLRQAGAGEVATLAELIETLKIYHVHGPLRAQSFCSLSCSGGEAGLVADLSEHTALEFPPVEPTRKAQLEETLGPLVPVANPLDYHTFIWGDGPKTEEVFTTMLDGYDAGIFVVDPPRSDRCDASSFQPSINAIETAARVTGKPAFPVASMPENFDEALAEAMIGRGVVPLMGLETALAALDAARAGVDSDWVPWASCAIGDTRQISEVAAKALLQSVGVSVPRGAEAASLAELVSVSDTLIPPLALKGMGFAHKTEAGAVRLNVNDLAREEPMPGATGYLAEEMITGGIAELLIGVRRDPVYGATLTLGIGGVEAELLSDTITLVAPVTADEIAAALRRLKLWPLLDGYRGRTPADTAAAIDVALKLQSLLADRPEIVEIEINPLILRAEGAVAVDALIEETET